MMMRINKQKPGDRLCVMSVRLVMPSTSDILAEHSVFETKRPIDIDDSVEDETEDEIVLEDDDQVR